MTRVIVHIDKLILRGIDRADAAAVSAGIETQLQQMLVSPKLAMRLADAEDRHRIRAGVVKTSKTGDARRLGRKAAKRIVKGVVA